MLSEACKSKILDNLNVLLLKIQFPHHTLIGVKTYWKMVTSTPTNHVGVNVNSASRTDRKMVTSIGRNSTKDVHF